MVTDVRGSTVTITGTRSGRTYQRHESAVKVIDELQDQPRTEPEPEVTGDLYAPSPALASARPVHPFGVMASLGFSQLHRPHAPRDDDDDDDGAADSESSMGSGGRELAAQDEIPSSPDVPPPPLRPRSANLRPPEVPPRPDSAASASDSSARYPSRQRTATNRFGDRSLHVDDEQDLEPECPGDKDFDPIKDSGVRASYKKRRKKP